MSGELLKISWRWSLGCFRKLKSRRCKNCITPGDCYLAFFWLLQGHLNQHNTVELSESKLTCVFWIVRYRKIVLHLSEDLTTSWARKIAVFVAQIKITKLRKPKRYF